MTKYIDFSIDYNGECESVDTFLIDDTVQTIDEKDVQPLIDELEKVEGFNISEHRTQVQIWWNDDDTMDIKYRYFNEPDWGEFDDFELFGLRPITFESELI